MRKDNLVCLPAALITVCALPAFAGPGWDEGLGGGDAGSTIPGGQVTVGVGSLTTIHGLLDGGGDQVDIFLIDIVDPVNFLARTAASFALGPGFSTFDTQLWLFDINGLGLLGNDNDPGGGFGSLITTPATDGGLAALPGPGLHYIAITETGANPFSAGGPIFNFISATEISSNDGPGGGSPLSGWSGGALGGEYFITLVGAEYAQVPAPSGLVLVLLGGIGIKRRRRL